MIGGGLLGLEAANGLEAARHGRDGRAPHAVADGAAARSHGRRHAAEDARGEGPRASASRRRRKRWSPASDGRVAGRQARVGGEIAAGAARRDGGRHPAQRRRSPRPPACIATAASWSTTRCRPSTRASTRSASASRIAARRTASWRRCSRWRKCAPTISRATASARYAGSQVSTKLKVTGVDLFSAGDFTRRQGHRGDRAGGPGAAASTRSSWSATTSSSAACCTATRRTAPGTSSCCATAAASRASATASCSARPTSATRDTKANRARCDGRRRRSVRLQRRVQGHDRQGDQGEGPLHARRRAQAHQGVVVVRLVHGPRRAVARWRLPAATIPRRPKQKPMCGCTDRTHQDVRDAIRAQRLLSIPDAMRFLEWRTPNGCATCRPAINYYLHLDVAEGRAGRSAVALHQRARARQHPEGRHLLGRAAHVGRRDQRLRASAHRRRRRQVRDTARSRSPAASASTCSA